MNYRYIILILVLLQINAVYATCIGYSDTFDVRVLDAKNRPISGADVQVKFDMGTPSGEQYFVTQPKKTNMQGMVHYTITNMGTNARTIDCKIVINATISGSIKTSTITAEQHGNIVDLALTDVYPVTFYVRDQFKAGISNATATVDSWGPGKTNKQGIVKGYLKTGNHEYFASYLDASASGIFTITNDSDFEVIFPYYPLEITVTDDVGTPLDATITISNQTFTMQNGHLQYPKVYGQQVPYEIEYMGIVVSDIIYPETSQEVEVRYDLHPPVILEVKSESDGNRPKLKIVASDNGIYASGLDVSSMKVGYKIEPSIESEAWHPAVVFTTAKNTFAAEFPEMESNTIIKFRIEVKDNAGNKAEREGKFTTLIMQNNTQNNTPNPPNPPPNPPQDQGIPLLYILGGVILLILAIYLVIHIKSKATGGGEKG